MNDEQILKKAIGKAIKNNYNIGNIQECSIWFLQELKDKRWRLVVDHMYSKNEYMREEKDGEKILFGEENNRYYDIEAIIFSHDFAKALWGQEIIEWLYIPFRAMDYHLREMVIAEKPLKYLESFL